MSGLPYEMLYPRPERPENVSQETRRERQQRQNAIGRLVLMPTEPIREPMENHNAVLLLDGDHGGAKLTKPRTELRGVPGATITRSVAVESSATVIGLRFRADGDADNNESLAVLGASAVVVFIGCTFDKLASLTGDFVTMKAGAKAHFIGCTFGPSNSSAGAVVNNAGAAADAYIIGCRNETGAAHMNVTVIAEV